VAVAGTSVAVGVSVGKGVLVGSGVFVDVAVTVGNGVLLAVGVVVGVGVTVAVAVGILVGKMPISRSMVSTNPMTRSAPQQNITRPQPTAMILFLVIFTGYPPSPIAKKKG
jgi:hypothetical protein